jgi:hypothetical protein
MSAVTSPVFSLFVLDAPSNLAQLSPPTEGTTLLSLLREVYDSAILKPLLPYKPNADGMERFYAFAAEPSRAAELKRIYAKWSLDTTLTGAALDAAVAGKVEECLWQATLLLAATGRPNRAPRLYFVLMHRLTSSLCLPSLLSALPDAVHKAQLLQTYALSTALHLLLRGRPRLDIPLLMSYTEFPSKEGETDPWLAIVQNALHHRDAHVIKTVRSLFYAAQRYGATPPGGAIGAHGADGKETHLGAEKMDGTMFVRAAGLVSVVLEWVAYGGKEGDWDMNALGWDAAWEGEDEKRGFENGGAHILNGTKPAL